MVGQKRMARVIPDGMACVLVAFLTVSAIGAKSLQNDAERRTLWFISAVNEAQALETRRLAEEGAPLESLGGVSLGVVSLGELRPEFRAALTGMKPGVPSEIVRVDGQFVLLEWGGAPGDTWAREQEAGTMALERGALDQAAAAFERAVQEAEAFGSEDARLLQSLTNLAETQEHRGQYVQARLLYERVLGIYDSVDGSADSEIVHILNSLAALYRRTGDHLIAEARLARALQILESNGAPVLDIAPILNNLAETRRSLGDLEGARAYFGQLVGLLEPPALPPDHPRLLAALRSMAGVLDEEGRPSAAAALYERVLLERWSGGATGGETSGSSREHLKAWLESLADFLELAYFRDTAFESANQNYSRTLSQVPVRGGGRLHGAVASLLFEVELLEPAEETLLRAVDALPASVQARETLAEFYQGAGRTEAALESFRIAVTLISAESDSAESDSEASRKASELYWRIGSTLRAMGRFDEAMTAFERSQRLAPEETAPRMALGSLFLARNQLEEAERQFGLATSSDESLAEAHGGLAEVLMREGRMAEAAAAARKALEFDPDLLTANYVLAMATIRVGNTDEGGSLLEAYQQRQAEVLAAANREKLAGVVNREAVAEFSSGNTQKALDLFRENIGENLTAKAVYLTLYSDLGVALRKLGQNREAANTFETMLTLGCCTEGGSFLVHRNLWKLYETLGETDASQEQYALYLKEYDTALLTRAGGRFE